MPHLTGGYQITSFVVFGKFKGTTVTPILLPPLLLLLLIQQVLLILIQLLPLLLLLFVQIRWEDEVWSIPQPSEKELEIYHGEYL